MKYDDAKQIGDKYVEILRPFVKRIEIAGSIRRECEECNDIEICAIRDNSKLFELAGLVDRWWKVKGSVAGKYACRILPEGIQLDLFFPTPQNWGNIFAIRTGSARFVHDVLAMRWVQMGYKSKDGLLHDIINPDEELLGSPIPMPEEKDLFEFLKLPWVEPRDRI